MSTALRTPRMTREQFLDWVATQEGRWEFDGFEPVAMTGGTRAHDRLCHNITSRCGHACAAELARFSGQRPGLRPAVTRYATRMPW